MKRLLISLLGLLLPVVMFAQIRVSGTVKDASGTGLPGATITQKGAGGGAVTDIEGKFNLEVSNENAVLVFTFLGYASQEVRVGTQRVFTIVMRESATEVDEVVVIGYGTRKKGDVTGSMVSVNEAAVKSRPVQNVVQALQGKVSGLDVISNVRPGNIGTVTIRGTRSMYTGKSLLGTNLNEPLYVIDGVIMMGTLNDINTNDIASIEILKDASATAIYGSRGANGVILITTKKGKAGEIEINYDGSVSFDRINSLTEWATAGESLDRYRQAYINAGEYKAANVAYTVPTLAADLEMFANNDANVIAALNLAYADGTYNSSKIPTTDWIGMLTRTGITNNHQLSLTAGTEKSKLYMSIGYYDVLGTQLNQSYNRITAKLNGEVTPKKWITLGLNVNLSRDDQQYGTINRSGSATGPKDLYGVALSQMLMAKPYDADNNIILYPGGNSTTPLYNPLIDLDESEDNRKNTNIQTNAFAEIRFAPWLKYRLNVGTALNNYQQGTWQSSESTLRQGTAGAGAAAYYTMASSTQWLIENILDFNKTFNDIHTIDATLMQSAQKYNRENLYLSASKIMTDAAKWYDLYANGSGSPDSYGSGYTGYQMASFMGRLNYSLLNRYVFTATVRWDGASVLAIQGDYFPAFAGAWKIQEESFMEDISWVNELKLRVGYGTAGNSAVEAYMSGGPLSKYSYVYGTTAALSYLPYAMPNPDLKWEKTTQIDVGLDFSFLNNRIGGSAEWYLSNSKDLLMERTLPSFLGYPYIIDNIGKTRNQGVELMFNTRNIATRDFSWNTDLSFATNKEEIIELVNGKEDMSGNGWYIGYPVQVFRTYEVDGLWQDTPEDQAEIALWAANGYKFAPGQYKPVEQGVADHKLTDDDKVIVGSNRPKWTGGMTNTIRYKDLELSCFIYARIGQKYFSSLQPGGSTGGKYVGYVRKADLTDFWSPTNTDAEWPQLYSAITTVSTTDVNQAMYINDGSFVAVRNISLSYNFPKKILKYVDVNRLQLYTQVLNPFMFGGKCVQNGINPDDTNEWATVNSVGDPVGGTNNNTMMLTSFVVGCRIGL